MLDHETIRSFIKVAECQSFSRAAELLHKTTATISYRIKTLEESIGTQLFIRTTRTVNLTPAGEYLLERCRQWHDWLDAMPGELRQINDGVEHQVNIVINNLLYNASAVAGLLAYLHEKYPFTQFHISRQVYMGVWDALLNEDCHLAIGAAGSESLENSINVLPLGKIEWVFAIAPQHPLANAPDPLGEAQLRAYPAINVEDTARHLAKRIAWLLSGQQEIKVPDLHTKLECHLRGLGIGFLPRRLCQPYIDRGELVEKNLKYPRHNSSLSLAWSDTRCGEAVKTIIGLFQTQDPLIAGLVCALD
ncbi:HTH-type transcriptional activator AllS [Serratia proteamaculans]|uniref:HTH-type transcriptional activator AllS n=1 Tax=Serratia proteamaculans TaxID=28151 RepID=A0ABS0TLJ1_SERPR|nr:HTH-type transcriptional activator AllS [Serratia proteamaculans]KAB1496910.1 HTH-type transcriptional activator AllS [Serratia proteamaculans]MBI6179226.1 HTH-type transcriptional activator AllS [Serratia proteamaculans]RYM51911.1 transcriptional regulator [Serratia proteamaculans]RYM54441.1 transcriptional regulator [Serratia proteamaculans]CAI0905894.1 HTH-type transcriptional activator AllS [Serratia proteamaculans]